MEESHLEQLLEAVKRQPGSPAFAMLAEHHIQEGSWKEACRVCKAGFAVNPGFERGVVAYLTVLRHLHDPRTAGDVFGRAVAFIPRSAKIRVQWAMILAESGRDQEARRFAREASDLSPLDRDARALVATLGGGTTRSSLHSRDDSAEHDAVAEPESDESDAEKSLSEQARIHRATVRPRVRPVGQSNTPHSMFDLTPNPMLPDLEERQRRRGLATSPFDITPIPEGTLVMDDEEPLEVEDLIAFEDSDVDSSSPPPPPPIVRPPAAGLCGPEPSLAAPDATASVVPLPLAPDTLQGRPTHRRYWLWIPLFLVLAGGGGGGGYMYYRGAEERKLTAAIEQALELTRLDQQAAFVKAQQALMTLRKAHPAEARITSGLILVNAMLVARFDGDASLGKSTWKMIGTPAPGDVLRRTAAALLSLQSRDLNKARGHLKGISSKDRSWHVELALILTGLASGQVQAVQKQMDMVVASPATAPALLLEAAKFYRRSNKMSWSRKYIDLGLKASPSHPGLTVQDALLRAQRGEAITADADRQLGRAAASPRLRGMISLVQALRARDKKDHAEAIRHGQRGNELDPTDPEIGTWLGVLQMGPGGDINKALALFDKHLPVMMKYDPGLGLWRARLLLLMGRPHEARTTLTRIPQQALSKPRQLWLAELEVISARHAGDREAVQKLCASPDSSGGNTRKLVACVEALLSRSKSRLARRLAKRIEQEGVARYLKGLRSLTIGDTGAAIRAFSTIKPGTLHNPIRFQLALASAFTRQGQAQRAIDILRPAVARDALSVRTQVALVTSLVAGGHDTEAQSILERVANARPTQASLVGQAGQAFLSLGLPAKALRVLKGSMKFNTRSTDIHLLAGRVALANRQVSEATSLFNDVLKMDPRSSAALVELGRIMVTQNKRRKAGKYFAKALRLRPRDPELLLSLSTVHAQTGQYKKSLTFGKRAIRMFHKSNQSRVGDALVLIGKNLRKGDRWAQRKAEGILYEATKLKPPPSSAFLEMGLLFQHQRDQNRAVWCFRQAVKRDRRFAEAQYYLGMAAIKKGTWRKEGKKALREFLKLQPTGKKATAARDKLKRL